VVSAVTSAVMSIVRGIVMSVLMSAVSVFLVLFVVLKSVDDGRVQSQYFLIVSIVFGRTHEEFAFLTMVMCGIILFSSSSLLRSFSS
jgi:hypothetical protein